MKSEFIKLECDACANEKTFAIRDGDKWNHFTEIEIRALNSNGVYSAPVILCRGCYNNETTSKGLGRLLRTIFRAR